MSVWTDQAPKKAGLYWWRQGDRIEPCEIREVGDTLEAWFIGEADPLIDWQWQPDWVWASLRTVEDWDNAFATGIHSCHPECQRPMCIQQRRIKYLEERLELWPVDPKTREFLKDRPMLSEDCDGIACREETIKGLDKRVEQMFDKGFMAGVDEYADDELSIGDISAALAEAKRMRL